MTDLSLEIQGMHCGGCVRRVIGVLSRLEGVRVQQVDVGSARVQLAGGSTGVLKIVAALEQAGYAATPQHLHAQ